MACKCEPLEQRPPLANWSRSQRIGRGADTRVVVSNLLLVFDYDLKDSHDGREISAELIVGSIAADNHVLHTK
jgi:hypothetical protein